MSDAETLRLRVKRQRDKLIDIIDSESGLLNILLQFDDFSEREIERIGLVPSSYEKNEMLLNCVARTDKPERLIDALSESLQTHVVNWIIADGEYRNEFGFDWPLTDKENRILRVNQATLVEILSPCELLYKLYSREVINARQRDFIKSKPTDHDKNEALLRIIRRMSLQSFHKLLVCLRDTKQEHVAHTLEFGGAIVPVHATLEADNLDETETQLVTKLHDLLCSNTTTMEQENRVLAALGLKVIAVRRGESIVLYVKCCTEEEFNHLCKVVDYMEMKETLQKLFNLFLPNLKTKVMAVTIFERDVAEAKKSFAQKQRNRRIRDGVMDMYRQFVSEVDPKNVLDLLIEKRVISIEQKEEFMIKVTRKERCRALLDHLLYSTNDESFIVLRDALEDQHPWIVERIDQCVTDNEITCIPDAKFDQNKITHTENQGQSEDPVHVILPFNMEERLKKEFDAAESNLEIKDRHLEQKLEESKTRSKKLEQELQESRKEVAEMKDQNRILKETLDKALDREMNLKKELDAIKSQAKLGIFGSLRKALGTTSKSSTPQLRHSTSSSESSKLFDSKVFVFGIDDGVSISKDVIEINLNRSDDVSEAEQIPVEIMYGSAATVLCDSFFVTGIGENCDEIWSFNVTSSIWKKCASLVQGRQCHSISFVDQVLYICGGLVYYGKKTLLDDVEAYDINKDQCVSVGKLALAFYGFGNCVPFKSSLYIFGGRDANDKLVNKVQVYDTKLNTCTLLSTSIPRAQGLLRAVLWESTVILLGYDCCLTYNFETEFWNVRENLKTDVFYFGLIISNGLLFVIGGGVRKEDAVGNLYWICRDDVRCIPLVNILKNEPIDWRHHATLPEPSLVYALGKMDFVLK